MGKKNEDDEKRKVQAKKQLWDEPWGVIYMLTTSIAKIVTARQTLKNLYVEPAK